jgi:DNA-binding MarR family transcriptional regulator
VASTGNFYNATGAWGGDAEGTGAPAADSPRVSADDSPAVSADDSPSVSADGAPGAAGQILDIGAREYGMSYARGRVVAALAASGPVLMRALSDAVGVTPRTVTGLIDALERDGWVERRAHPSDRRATVVALTPAGEAAFAKLNESYGDLSRDMVSGIPEPDLHTAMRVIEHISAQLDDAISRGTAALQADPPPLPQDHPRTPPR